MLKGMNVWFKKQEGENALSVIVLLDICKPLYQNENGSGWCQFEDNSFLSREHVLLFGQLHVCRFGLIE